MLIGLFILRHIDQTHRLPLQLVFQYLFIFSACTQAGSIPTSFTLKAISFFNPTLAHWTFVICPPSLCPSVCPSLPCLRLAVSSYSSNSHQHLSFSIRYLNRHQYFKMAVPVKIKVLDKCRHSHIYYCNELQTWRRIVIVTISSWLHCTMTWDQLKMINLLLLKNNTH